MRLDRKEREQRVIENYQNDERMMILIYAQWCINHDLDPKKMYDEAYPNQVENDALTDALELTVPKQESDEIDVETVLNVLQLFGNDDLAFIVQEAFEKRAAKE